MIAHDTVLAQRTRPDGATVTLTRVGPGTWHPAEYRVTTRRDGAVVARHTERGEASARAHYATACEVAS